MKSVDYLRLNLMLILSQHGEAAVLEGLASIIGTSPEELRARLDELEDIGHVKVRAKARPATARSTVEAVIAAHPEKADLLRKIQLRFIDRTFLPELKDIRRFLDRHGEKNSTLKKRDDGFAKVVRCLAQLSRTELESILNAPIDSEYSSLGVISDQILGRT